MSCFDMVKFEKGQIWEIYFKNKNEPKGREQSKNRPWIILSTRKFNQSSGMVTAAPITTRDAIVSPAQVLFTNMDGKNNVILCEQMRTFDYKSGSYVFEYMGCVSDEITEMLDNALSIHLGLKFAPSTLDRLYQSIESIMRSLEISRNQTSYKFTDDDVIRFAEKLESLIPKKPDISEVIETPINPTEKVIETPINPTEEVIEPIKFEVPEDPINKNNSTEEVSSCNSKLSRRKWTKETCEEFLKDMSTLPMKEVMVKWGMSKKTQVYYTKHYVQNIMTNL